MKITEDKIKACILGHAVGDALGVPVEFSSRAELDMNHVIDMRGYGTYDVPPGSWSDDTSMTLCALDGLSDGKFKINNVMTNFCHWYYFGEFTPGGKMFDIGGTCRKAIENYFVNHKDVNSCGLSDDKFNGNGSLMRIIPFILYAISAYDGNTEKLWDTVSIGSALTHAHPVSRTACQIYSTVLLSIIENPEPESVRRGIELYREYHPDEIQHFRRIDFDILKSLKREEIRSSGYVVDTFGALFGKTGCNTSRLSVV